MITINCFTFQSHEFIVFKQNCPRAPDFFSTPVFSTPRVGIHLAEPGSLSRSLPPPSDFAHTDKRISRTSNLFQSLNYAFFVLCSTKKGQSRALIEPPAQPLPRAPRRGEAAKV